MSTSMALLGVLLLASLGPSADAVSMRGGMERFHSRVTTQHELHRKRCPSEAVAMAQFKMATAKVNTSGMAKHPGTGMNPKVIKDELLTQKKIYKDGYYATGCFKDYMYYHGDKFGDNKYEYELEDTSKVSIVFPLAYIPKEDQKSMTVNYCYSMCRQLENMTFFGIVNGRDCYCAPFMKPMAGDDSVCSSPCEGDKSASCGSKTKSTIFSMHSCDNTREQLLEFVGPGGLLGSLMGDLSQVWKLSHRIFVSRTVEVQKAFGDAGDPEVSHLFQATQDLFAEERALAAKKRAHFEKSQADYDAAVAVITKDLTVSMNADEADALLAALADDVAKAEKFIDAQHQILVDHGYEAKEYSNRIKQYYPIMYFEDKKYSTTPTSCSGKLLKAYVGPTEEQCAGLCDDTDTEGCVGFLYVPGDMTFYLSSFCFTFTQITSIQYYTKPGCPKSEIMCYGKFSKLAGSSPLDKKKGQKATEASLRCMPAIGQ